MSARLTFIHALSPLHAGTGQGVGIIDLPTAREAGTGLPFFPGSSLKGSLRDLCEDDADRRAVFGPPTDEAEVHAGTAQFSDQRLLLLPIRSLVGTFAWVTSPLLLQRLARDVSAAGQESAPPVPAVSRLDGCLVAATGERGIASALTLESSGRSIVVLEDLDLAADESADVTAWAVWIGERIFPEDGAWQAHLLARLCVVHDDVLGFLADTALEVTARVQLSDQSKTVGNGPWYEESLPAETVLAGLVIATPVRNVAKGPAEILDVVGRLARRPVQLGGKATVGRGLCRVLVGG